MSEVLVLRTGDISCHIQVTYSNIYALVSMKHEKASCMIIVNDDRHLFRDLEDRLVPGHSEREFFIIKSLDIHEMIPRDQ